MSNNPLRDPIKNPLKRVYENFWVPVFGRVLNLFTTLIEGQPSQERQTYNLRDKAKN